jgi:hypothetical protein
VVRSTISKTVCQFVSIAPIVNFQRQIANLKFLGKMITDWADLPLLHRCTTLRWSGRGTDLGSFAKMIELSRNPARP